ncbi:MAG: asparagine--tRNA ligase, partial [Myxococcales bacterium]|nr:asparagine--tRNA ligase [Myxococcales bacterium]
MQVSVDDVLKGRGAAKVGETVTVGGWVRTRRDSKAGLSFVALSDGSCFDTLQLVAKSDLENYADVQKLTSGCSIEASGTVKASEGKGQSVEIEVTSITVVGWVADPDTYPISQKRHTFEYLREVAHLRPRTNTFGAVARMRHALSQAIHRFFHDRG